MRVPSGLIQFIHGNDNFLIATHINPEADALGSSIALYSALVRLGKKAVVFSRDSVPAAYRFLPHSGVVTDVIPSRIDTMLLLDCNSPQRAGLEGREIGKAAVIDHHKTVRDFGDIKWIVPDAPATGLMVYYLIQELGAEIDADTASNIYAAVVTDTGFFKFSNTTFECMRVASELVRKGANPTFIAEKLLNNYSKGRFFLLKEVLNGVKLYGGIAVAVITDEMFGSTGTSSEDTENFVNFPLMMDDIKVSALIRQTDKDSWKVSLRSKGDIDISEIAAAFDGGGHRNAAGYKVDATLAETEECLLKKLKEVVS